MDTLKAEIASKRKALQDDPLILSRPNKYMRKGEIEKLRMDREQKEKEAKAAKEQVERFTKSSVRSTSQPVHNHTLTSLYSEDESTIVFALNDQVASAMLRSRLPEA